MSEAIDDMTDEEMLARFGQSPPQYVYRVYDADDVLLYVGRSRDPDSRMIWHQRPWYSGSRRNASEMAARIARYTVSEPMREGDAELAEAIAIWDENPVFNLWRPWQRPTPRRPAPT